MNFSAIFIRRPVATTLITLGIVLSGVIAFRLLPVAPLPQVDFPTIQVSAGLPGADPETMATSVAAPLERQFGRIAGVTEMTSTSFRGTTNITLQFDLNRNIDGASRDVQAAINAARGYLPPNLPNNPTYRKVNPADAPILLIALQSDLIGTPQLYDAASSIMQQKLSQVKGVGQVFVGGSSLPAVRVEVNPTALNKYGIGMEDVRGVLASTNVNKPKGQVSDDTRTWEIKANDQLQKAYQYQEVIVAYRSGAAVRLADVASVKDSVEDVNTAGLTNGKPSVMVIVFRQPGANIIETVDRVRDLLPQLAAALPGSAKVSVVQDRTPPIRGSLKDVELSLMISAALVILVVFGFLRHVRSTIIPAVAVGVSLIGTFGVMYLCGYNLDNLSLMALTERGQSCVRRVRKWRAGRRFPGRAGRDGGDHPENMAYLIWPARPPWRACVCWRKRAHTDISVQRLASPATSFPRPRCARRFSRRNGGSMQRWGAWVSSRPFITWVKCCRSLTTSRRWGPGCS